MGKRYIPKHSSRKAKKNRTGTAMAALAMSFVLLLILISAALGKYQHQIDNDGYVRAKDFYFTSNLLDGGTHTLAPIDSTGKTSVTFTLGNHADELRCSEVDINYEVKVEPDSSGVTIGQDTNQTLTKNIIQDDTVTLTFANPGTYTVTAIGTGGYTKTLTATIVIPDQSAHLYQYRENGDGYVLLTVWNEGNQDGDVTITYSGIPDNTNPDMTDWKTDGSSETVTIKAHESKVFRFFGGGVTLDVTQGGNSVNTKSPH